MDEGLRTAVITCMVLSACGSDAPTPGDIGKKFADTLCAAKARCCQAQGEPLSATEMSSCLLAVAPVPSRSSPVPPAQAQFNADVAQRCLDAASRYDCANGIQITNACSFVFTGHVAIGGTCTGFRDCEQPSGGHAGCHNGTCVAETFNQGVGAACPHGDQEECDLANGLWCAPAGVCAAALKMGDPCNVIAACPAGTYCTAMSPQVCAPQLAIGAACDTFFSCQPPGTCTNGVCVAAGYCVALDPI